MRWMILSLVLCTPLCAIEPSNVLVVYNEKVEGGLEIAEYYAALRGIPKEQILKLSASDKEEISRDEYNTEIRKPVLEFIKDRGNICCIVPVRGVALKIRDRDNQTTGPMEGHDEAAVDSELSAIRGGDYDIDRAVTNTFYKKEARLTQQEGLVVVSRLDGPTVAIVKGMIEKAIIAETLGCEGRAFLDTRDLRGGEAFNIRDDAMEGIKGIWEGLGLSVTHDAEPDVADLSKQADLLHYVGWYAAVPPGRGTPRFRTGAVAMHLHSFCAVTVRQEKAWVGPMLAWGATCSYGTVYEPYLEGFPNEDILWNRLAAGWQFGEAMLAATPVLSWQSVNVGDPLYQPYPEGFKELRLKARKAVMGTLLPVEGETVDSSGIVAFDACLQLLKARADNVAKLAQSNPSAAMDAFYDARFLVQDMGLDAWSGAMAKPFEQQLKARVAAMRAAAKEDLTDTAELEKSLVDWKGLGIYPELEKLRDELIKSQEKEAKTLLRRAQGSQKVKGWLKAWREAAEAAAHNLAPTAVEAAKLLEELKPNITTPVKDEANRALKGDVERAQKHFEKGKYPEARKALGKEWKYFPDCDQRKDAAALAQKIETELKRNK